MAPFPRNPGDAKLVVPKEVEFTVTAPVVDDERILQLELSAYGGPSGSYTGPLIVDVAVSEGLQFTIHGFEYESRGCQDSFCPADVQPAKANFEVDPAWLASTRRNISFTLAGNRSRYSMSREQVVVTTVARKTSTVKFKDPTMTKLETIIYPPDVGMLSVSSGHGNRVRDLSAFAEDHGWTDPFDEYGFAATKKDERFRVWVIVRNRSLPPADTSVEVGTLPNGSRVYLARPY